MGMFIEAFADYGFMLILYIILELIVCRVYRHQGLERGRGFVIGWQVLALYLTTVFAITGAGGLDDAFKYSGNMFDPEQINYIPIFNWGIQDPIGMALNVFMFIPLGIALPLLWQSSEKPGITVLTGFTLSLLIELSQLFNLRATDVDDLIMNTLGALLGWLLYRFLFKKARLFKVSDASQGKSSGRGLANVCIIFAVFFIAGSPIIKYIWRLIYLGA